jgi:hypothetical protein
MKKFILPALLGGLLLLIGSMAVGMIFNAIFPGLATEYTNPGLFRPWSDPLMNLYYLHPFLTMLLLAWIWDLVKPVVLGKNTFGRGLKFGLAFWVVSGIPGMLISFASFQVSLLMILSWLLGNLIGLIISCWVFPQFNK